MNCQKTQIVLRVILTENQFLYAFRKFFAYLIMEHLLDHILLTLILATIWCTLLTKLDYVIAISHKPLLRWFILQLSIIEKTR